MSALVFDPFVSLLHLSRQLLFLLPTLLQRVVGGYTQKQDRTQVITYTSCYETLFKLKETLLCLTLQLVLQVVQLLLVLVVLCLQEGRELLHGEGGLKELQHS